MLAAQFSDTTRVHVKYDAELFTLEGGNVAVIPASKLRKR